jgi:hypothetical protein
MRDSNDGGRIGFRACAAVGIAHRSKVDPLPLARVSDSHGSCGHAYTIGTFVSRSSFWRMASVKSSYALQVTAKAPGPPMTSRV